MLKCAAAGHRALCLGQGEELCWVREPRPLSAVQVIDIFRRKTAPAFEVALKLGAIYSGADEETLEVLEQYSEALGIGYQIKDDLEDFSNPLDPADAKALRPSLLLAVAHERADKQQKPTLDQVWRRQVRYEDIAGQIEKLVVELKADERARGLLDSYKEEAVRSLRLLENASLKGLLRRVMTKIFNDLTVKEWCSEFEARNAPGGEVGAAAVG